MNKDRKQTSREVEEYPGNILPCELHAHMEIWWPQLTFDSGNNSSSRTQDVHRVEPLVFADYGLQDSQQLPETLMHRLVEAFLVLWKEQQSSVSHRAFKPTYFLGVCFLKFGILYQQYVLKVNDAPHCWTCTLGNNDSPGDGWEMKS